MKPATPTITRKWKIYFSFLALANILTIIFPLLVLLWAVNMARQGVSGTEYIAIIIAPLQLLGILVAVLNVFTISIFLRKSHVRGMARAIGQAIVIISALYVTAIAVTAFKDIRASQKHNAPLAKQEAISLISSCKVKSISRQDRLILFLKQESQEGHYQVYAEDQDFTTLKAAADEASGKCGEIDVLDRPENYHAQSISVKKASKLLNGCKLIGFYYTEHENGSDEFDAEGSPTGIVLAYKEDPLHIHIADRLVPTMVPVARKAQEKCPDLQFWHDGSYEYKNSKGNWQTLIIR